MVGRGRKLFLGCLVILLGGAGFSISLHAAEPLRAEEQLIKPEVHRRDIKVSGIDSENFEVGYYTGLMSVEDFGVNAVKGVMFAYHLTEDVFLLASTGQTITERSTQEEYSGSDIFTETERELSYINVMLGYNLFPGEVFWGSDLAFNTDIYITIGSGTTDFGGDEHSTFVYGIGYRFIGADWLSIHFDMRNHTFEHDYFARSKTVDNLEYTFGLAVFF